MPQPETRGAEEKAPAGIENGETVAEAGSKAKPGRCEYCGLEVADEERARPMEDLIVEALTGKPAAPDTTRCAHRNPAYCIRALAISLHAFGDTLLAVAARTTHLERRVEELEHRARARDDRKLPAPR